jgi:Spy/CpxP family protein refolding chaperone
MTTRILTSVFVCILSVALFGHQQGAPSSGRGQQDQKAKAPSIESRPGPRPPFPWWTKEKYRQELKLTADQTAQIEKIFQASMGRMKVQKDDLDRAQSDFSQLMKTATANERELIRAADSLELAKFKVSSERTNMLVRIHSVLTAEQRVRLQEIWKRDRDDDKNRTR